MEFRNTTDYSDAMLRRLLAWTCKQVDFPQRSIRAIWFRNRARSFSGRAWASQRIVVSIGPQSVFPIKPYVRRGVQMPGYATREEALAGILAHELGHLKAGYWKGRWGGDETQQMAIERRVAAAFQARASELLAEWNATKKTSQRPSTLT